MAALLAASAFILAVQANAAPAASAKVASAVGRVSVQTAGARRRVKTGDALIDGDAIETAKSATAVVALPDGTELKLRELSSVTLKLPGSGSSSAFLSFGGVFAKVAKQALGSSFQVRTESAVAAVRGTQFFTAFGRAAKGGRDLWVCVNEGVVDVSTDASEKPLAVPAGKGVLIKAGKDLTAPQSYDWTKKLNWNMDPGRGGIEDKTDLDKAYSDLLDQDYR